MAQISSQLQECAACDIKTDKVCSGCKVVSFCSTRCQGLVSFPFRLLSIENAIRDELRRVVTALPDSQISLLKVNFDLSSTSSLPIHKISSRSREAHAILGSSNCHPKLTEYDAVGTCQIPWIVRRNRYFRGKSRDSWSICTETELTRQETSIRS